MKKLTALILVLACILGVVGCDADRNVNESPAVESPEVRPQTGEIPVEDDDAVDVPVEDIPSDIAMPGLTIRTLRSLIERYGEGLSWDTFDAYSSREVGSGLYILYYPVGMDYHLLIGGGSVETPPMYIYLVSEYDPNHFVDVINGNIDYFLNSAPQTAEFSYEEALETYRENDPGVKYSGFVNTERTAVERVYNVICRAENECTIGHDTVSVAYDSVEQMWAVTFFTAGTLGDCQTVYMDMDGVTRLIVYGE